MQPPEQSPAQSREQSPEQAAALAFADVADAYERGRPGYPREAVEWLTGRSPATVVELGAGTGKLTERLLELGHDVLATDPLDEMLAHLRLRHPDLRTATAPAEAIPAATRTVDVVVAAQAFHWFDAAAALKEAARVLRAEGRIGLVWNHRDERIPWVRRLGAVIGSPRRVTDPTDALVASGLFGFVEEASFRTWQQLTRHQLHDLVRSRSHVALLDTSARERMLRRVDELYDACDTGPDGLLLPYTTRCFRAVVRPRGLIEEPEHSADLTAAAQAVREAQEGPRGPGADAAPGDDGATLIDFR